MNYLIWILLLFTNFCFCVDLKVTDIARRVTSRAKNAIGWSLKSGVIHYFFQFFFKQQMHIQLINKKCQEIISKTYEVHINPNYITIYFDYY